VCDTGRRGRREGGREEVKEGLGEDKIERKSTYQARRVEGFRTGPPPDMA